ncbi:MAG TPA: type II toxin-antitoxin system VapB family antitoxin [Candidatus Kapabacteria bacterium]|nr:type II toxin-antitoxin system VapB family antitoxin [Candidatus Kapabacteria bacterium]
MKTTLNLPDALVNDLVIETGEKNKTRLIKTALEEMLRAIKRKKLINLSGKMELDLTVKGLVNEREMDMI